MKIWVGKLLLAAACYMTCVIARPQSYGNDADPEARLFHRKGNRGGGQPCANFNRPIKGRTFFDWPSPHFDITYNYHYNINCGGGSTGGGGEHPVIGGGGLGGGHPGTIGGGHLLGVGGGQSIGGLLLNHKKKKPNKLNALVALSEVLGGSNNHGGGSPTQSQSQTQTLIANFGHLGQDILGTLFPPEGLFNGQLLDSIGNVGSSIGNTLSSVFSSTTTSSSSSSSPGTGSGGGAFNPLGGLLGGIFNRPGGGGGGGGSGTPSGGGSGAPSGGGGGGQGGVQTTTLDPDDIIYNDEKPVHEEHDEVPEVYNNFRPRPRPPSGNYYNRYQSGNRNRYQQNSFYNEKFIGAQNYNRRY